MSESLLESLLSSAGLEALAFAILHELAHVAKRHIRSNLAQTHRLGDLRRQLFLFDNQYIGFDALFQDYYTNTRFTLDQELEADMFALRVMQGMGLGFRGEEDYRSVLKILESGEAEERNKLKNGVDKALQERVKRRYLHHARLLNPTMKVVKPEIQELREALKFRV